MITQHHSLTTASEGRAAPGAEHRLQLHSDVELEKVTPGQRLEGGWPSGEGREKERKVQAEETATACCSPWRKKSPELSRI